MATKEKRTYKVTNWKEYNKSLIERGNITIWFSDEALENWEHPNDQTKVGRPFVFSDTAIECLLTIRELLKLPYRQTEGFGRSLVAMLGVEAAIPNYSSLAKRASKLNVSLDIANKRGDIDIVVDSTGMKVFGEGEWKMRTHGKSKRRTWRKLHLSVNPDTREIVAEILTENSCHDADAVPEMLEQVEQPVKKFHGDGSYDKWKVYEGLESEGIEPVIPPQHNAKIKQHGNSAEEPLPRDEAIRQIRRKGRRSWKEEVGYHRRSLAETTMYRVKQSFGSHLKNRVFENQQTEARLRCKIINQFTQLGLPQFEWS
ncbi:IS5 family transposase [Aeoliella mucimassa]|uniref:Transposase DDE domain protein n=1 Tax=Aeoliella mucimassa TaxID=2527972 RepID=A0A518AR29_9BACT|nr:IS5 family transposase [Aeoliella mucimassa]QDU53847.1 Transposase DDE domain protein [Aeoliella mucimassa]QDU53886.1 Transposase DDE domain protein [Aeoliella mucimassa]QDU53903.1 Transposase DDE domain protein [Aeoliella mucimassa]QDU54058.1 Transposase DDE domain protein [Aeoliella mucimassa]QDU54076.1 Transposase DDE domain protein [Aeoliella mucimassa]